MDARAVLVGWLIAVGAGPALAQDASARWRGAWQVAGQTSWRHVGGTNDALELEGRVGDLDVRLRGRGDARGLSLTGEGARISGEPAVWTQHAMRLEARAAASGALEVTIEVAGERPWRERWVKPTAPGLSVRAIGAPPRPREPSRRRPAPDDADLRFEPGAADLVLEVVVEGRPMSVALQVLADPDDARYAHLDGLVHHVDLADGAPLPIGRHRVTWSGADRSTTERLLLPGRYHVLVTTSDAPLGPPPGEEAAPRAALALVVPDDATPPTASAAPAGEEEGGLAGRVDVRGPREPR
jgi:hypothetical protein